MLWPSVHRASGTAGCEGQRKRSQQLSEFSTSPQAYSGHSRTDVRYSHCVAFDEALTEATGPLTAVFSSRTSTNVFLKTTLSAPTPGYFTSFRIFVDSIPDAGKDGRLAGTTVAGSLVSQPLRIKLICTVSV